MIDKNPMEYIWDQIPKQADGKTIHYLKGDLDYLYLHGFVSSRTFKLSEWKAAFTNFKQPDGSYVLTKDQFLSLSKFRYTGLVEFPFDPGFLKERPYTDAELKRLFDHSLSLTSDANEEFYWAYINAFKKQGHVDEHGNLIMNFTVKAGLYAMMEKFPSPRRRLEKEVLRIRVERDRQLLANQMVRDKSSFMVGQTGIETQKAALDDLQSSTGKGTKKDTAYDYIKSDKDSVDIKKLRKPPKKFKG